MPKAVWWRPQLDAVARTLALQAHCTQYIVVLEGEACMSAAMQQYGSTRVHVKHGCFAAAGVSRKREVYALQQSLCPVPASEESQPGQAMQALTSSLRSCCAGPPCVSASSFCAPAGMSAVHLTRLTTGTLSAADGLSEQLPQTLLLVMLSKCCHGRHERWLSRRSQVQHSP